MTLITPHKLGSQARDKHKLHLGMHNHAASLSLTTSDGFDVLQSA